MGANAQTSVPTFTAGQVLTAAQMNESARTGVPVAADASARDGLFGGTGEKVLAEGQLVYLEDLDVVQYYDGSSWATVGPAAASALTLISTTTIGSAVASVTVTGAFSNTYDNYLIHIAGGVGSTAMNLGLQLGATTTGYYAGYSRVTYSTGAANTASDNNAAIFTRFGAGSSNALNMSVTLLGPNLATRTFAYGDQVSDDTGSVAGAAAGFLNNATQYTAFTIVPSTGTITGGVIRVYGYANS